MIYVPDFTDINNKCVYMSSNNVLRVYDSQPNYNSDVTYTDYMVDNHYLYRTGITHFTAYSTLPECLPTSSLTNNWGYRTDLTDILICLVILIGSIVFVFSKALKLLFRGWC